LLDEEYEELLGKDRMRILYGNTAVGANAAWTILTQFGYENLFVLDAGIDDWISQVQSKEIINDTCFGDEASLFDYDEIMKDYSD
jgi:hypothetical protein